MPGWNPSFNPSTAPGCHLNPMYNEPGLGAGASFGSGAPTAVAGSEGCHPTAMLAAPVAVPEGPVQKDIKMCKSSPAHLLLTGHALIFGALSATQVNINDTCGTGYAA